MPELTDQQVATLERLRASGFALVAFPLYASYIGVRRGEFAALLAPVPGGGMRLFGDAFVLVNGNPAVRVRRGCREAFIWKGSHVPATPERVAGLVDFTQALTECLLASV